MKKHTTTQFVLHFTGINEIMLICGENDIKRGSLNNRMN